MPWKLASGVLKIWKWCSLAGNLLDGIYQGPEGKGFCQENDTQCDLNNSFRQYCRTVLVPLLTGRPRLAIQKCCCYIYIQFLFLHIFSTHFFHLSLRRLKESLFKHTDRGQRWNAATPKTRVLCSFSNISYLVETAQRDQESLIISRTSLRREVL